MLQRGSCEKPVQLSSQIGHRGRLLASKDFLGGFRPRGSASSRRYQSVLRRKVRSGYPDLVNEMLSQSEEVGRIRLYIGLIGRYPGRSGWPNEPEGGRNGDDHQVIVRRSLCTFWVAPLQSGDGSEAAENSRGRGTNGCSSFALSHAKRICRQTLRILNKCVYIANGNPKYERLLLRQPIIPGLST